MLSADRFFAQAVKRAKEQQTQMDEEKKMKEATDVKADASQANSSGVKGNKPGSSQK